MIIKKCSTPEWIQSSFIAKESKEDHAYRILNVSLLGISTTGILSVLAGIGGIPSAAFCVMALFVARKVVSIVIGYLIHPAALASILGWKKTWQGTGEIQKKNLSDQGLSTYSFSLYKGQIRYDAYLIVHPNLTYAKKWILYALPNAITAEDCLIRAGNVVKKEKKNVLLINPPSVVNSGGFPTRYHMGSYLEAGLQFLEDRVEASHITMDASSLGGGMMAEAILQHDFTKGLKRKIHYTAIMRCTFATLSCIGKAFVGKYANPVLFFAGMELDGIAAARKLSDLKIKQIIVQHQGTKPGQGDGIIPDVASLATELQRQKITQEKEFLLSPHISHNDPLPKEIEQKLDSLLH